MPTDTAGWAAQLEVLARQVGGGRLDLAVLRMALFAVQAAVDDQQRW